MYIYRFKFRVLRHVFTTIKNYFKDDKLETKNGYELIVWTWFEKELRFWMVSSTYSNYQRVELIPYNCSSQNYQFTMHLIT